MATMYARRSGTATLRCYSERGLLSYFMFHVLPTRMVDFLAHIESADGTGSPFSHIDEVSNINVFSELDFGNAGFGKPDGGIYFEAAGQPYFILPEVKLNESYLDSCARTASYNSTIRGQLELRWRAMTQYKAGVYHAPDGVRYIRESTPMIQFYSRIDSMYAGLTDFTNLTMAQIRRLRLVEGVGDIFDTHILPCPFKNIFYVAITNDASNPFLRHPNHLPRCARSDGLVHQDSHRQFGWANVRILEWLPDFSQNDQ